MALFDLRYYSYTMNKKYIIVAALEQETPDLENFAPVVHTGIGKVNASIRLYEAILRYRPDLGD